MNERPAPAEPATSNDITPGPLSEHELRDAWNQQSDPFNQWDSLDTGEQLAWAQARAIAADRAGHSTPARLRHCPTHGHQPPEAWGCPECVRGLRKELKALRAAIAADRAGRPAQAEPADMAVEQLQHIIHREPWATWLRPGGCLESAHCELTDLLSSAIAADRAGRPAPVEPGRVERLPDGKPYPTPPAEGEVGDPSDEKLTQFLFENFRGPIEFICDAEEEAHVMIRNHVKFASAVLARWGRQTAPVPAEGEVGELVAWLQRTADVLTDGNTQTPRLTRAAALLQEQEAELTQCREALRRVRLQQRIPGGGW